MYNLCMYKLYMYIDICLLQMFGGKTDRLVTFTVNCLYK